MILEFLVAVVFGIILGTFTGVTPGVHTNLVSVFLVSISAYFLEIVSPEILVVAITSLAVTHTFIDFVPSIFLGAPDEDTALSVSPGHDFLLKGRGHEAVLLTLIGSSIAIIIFIFIIPVFVFTIDFVYPVILKLIPFILVVVSVFLIFVEKTKEIAFIVFVLAGFLGIASLNLNIEQPLLPLLTGLFGSSTLVYSIFAKTKVPEQKTTFCFFGKRQLIKPVVATAIVSPICSFLPGLGSSQAAIISSSFFKEKQLSREQFMILLGSINTLVICVSFLTLYFTSKTRTGSASAISQLIQLDFHCLLMIIFAIFLTSIISIPLTIFISKIFAKNIHKINYLVISKFVLFFLVVVVLVFSGFAGFFVFLVSTILGLFCIYVGCRRGFLMGALLIPTILFYLPF